MSIAQQSGAAASFADLRPEGAQHRLSGRARARDRVPGLLGGAQRGAQPRARQHRLRLRLLEQDRRLRHQPDADRVFVEAFDLRPRLLGRPAQHAAGRGARHRARDHPRLPGRHRAAVAELAGGAARDRLRRADPQRAAAAAVAVLVQRRAQGAAGPARQHGRCRAAAFSTIAASSCRSRSSSPAFELVLGRVRRRRRSARSPFAIWATQAPGAHRPAVARRSWWRSG